MVVVVVVVGSTGVNKVIRSLMVVVVR